MNQKCLLLLVLMLGLSLWAIGCATDEQDEGEAGNGLTPPTDGDFFPDGWHWKLLPDQSLRIYYGNRPLLVLTGVEQRKFEPSVSMLFGFFEHKKKRESVSALDFAQEGDRIVFAHGGNRAGALTLEPTPEGNLRVLASLAKQYQGDAIRFNFALGKTDAFWGFGEQYSFVDFRGQHVPVWVQEQGVERSEFSLLPFVGELTDTYFPMPYFLDPRQGKGFLVENTEYAAFDLGAASADRWSVEVWNGGAVSFVLFPGPEPADVVAQLTQVVGRPAQRPPDWAFGGLWLAAQGGTEPVRDRVQVALDAGIPVTAVWSQDWVGLRDFGLENFGVKYRWIHDETLYPDLDLLIDELNAKGVRFLGYFNNFIGLPYEHWAEAAARGLMVHRQSGEPYLFPIITFMGSILDVTHPEAIDYFKGYARKAIELGMSGWMADFGEWLPFDAQIYSGDARALHNLYPTAWHRINREVLSEAFPQGDYVMLTRSGYTGEHAVAQIVWAGDQEATWSHTDGLPTVVTAGLTLGLSGIPIFTHDLGGFSGGPSTKELYMRWTELAAFSPVMRTHDGLKKLENHTFDTDAETLAHFTMFAKIHQALLPYFLELADQGMTLGLPIVRHTVLVDPDWPESYSAHWQWMLGNDLLLAPVVTEGAESVGVAFPEGQWEHLLTGESFAGRTVQEVFAPIGTPAIFVRSGRMSDLVEMVRAL